MRHWFNGENGCVKLSSKLIYFSSLFITIFFLFPWSFVIDLYTQNTVLEKYRNATKIFFAVRRKKNQSNDLVDCQKRNTLRERRCETLVHLLLFLWRAKKNRKRRTKHKRKLNCDLFDIWRVIFSVKKPNKRKNQTKQRK